jgi:hypothetical protein
MKGKVDREGQKMRGLEDKKMRNGKCREYNSGMLKCWNTGIKRQGIKRVNPIF